MRYLIVCIGILVVLPTFASSTDHKEALKQLYGEINQSASPKTDPKIQADISRLMNEGCLRGANRALAKKNYDPKQKQLAEAAMQSMCKCIADSDSLKNGVIDSALLLKKEGSHSTKAKTVLLNGMKEAKTSCMQRMMELNSKNKAPIH